MQTLPSGIKKYEANDNATVANFNANADLLDAKIQTQDAHIGSGGAAHANAVANGAAGFMTGADKAKIDSATAAATPDTLVKRDGSGRFKAAAPVAADDVARKAETDAASSAAAAAQGTANSAVSSAATVQTNLNTHAAIAANTSGAGHVQLNTATNSTSTTQAATPSAVKAAYDLAAAALPKGGGEVTGPLTVSGNGGLSLSYGWGIASSNGNGEALYGNNCYLSRDDGQIRYRNTHANLGARGIIFRPAGTGKLWWFDTGNSATTADQAFTPTLYEVITSVGGQMSGFLVLGNEIRLQGKTTTGDTKYIAVLGADNKVYLGDATLPLYLNGTSAVINGKALWYADTQGDPATLNTTSKQIVGAINELFTSASNGKTAIAAAITGKGVPASGSDSFATLATKIGQLTNVASGSGTITGAGNTLTVNGLSFTPKIILCQVFYNSFYYSRIYSDSLIGSNGYMFQAGGSSVNTGGFTVTGSGFSCNWISGVNGQAASWIAYG